MKAGGKRRIRFKTIACSSRNISQVFLSDKLSTLRSLVKLRYPCSESSLLYVIYPLIWCQRLSYSTNCLSRSLTNKFTSWFRKWYNSNDKEKRFFKNSNPIPWNFHRCVNAHSVLGRLPTGPVLSNRAIGFQIMPSLGDTAEILKCFQYFLWVWIIDLLL